MAEPKDPARRLVLVGAGHAHLFVLEQLAMGRFPAAQVTLLSPHRQHLYSGMLGGLIAGRYRPEDAHFDLSSLATRAGARLMLGSAVQVDAVNRRISLDGGGNLPYDIASFAVGAETEGTHTRSTDAVFAVKPIDQAELIVEALDRLVREHPRVIVVGGGAGGVEIALTIKAHLRSAGRPAGVALIGKESRLIPNRSEACAREAARALGKNQVTVFLGRPVAEVTAGAVRLSDGTDLAYDVAVSATGAAAPALFRQSGLETDTAGFLLVDDTLRSGDSAIFAAGDAASLRRFPETPKSGVYAVRQGPVLARNLKLALTGAGPERFRRYRPQPRSLVLINTGDGKAILSYGAIAITARWVMRLKDRIDRGFMRRFSVDLRRS
jgi:pyridine nucleotide-disulfide oxidoreductase family protein